MQTAEQVAYEALEKMAREINKDLPPDLWNYLVQISMSTEGVYATATPLADMQSADEE